MPSKTKTLQETGYEIQALIVRMFVEITFRDVFGVSPVKAFKRIYGKKWKKEGYTFDMAFDKVFDEIYKQILRERKAIKPTKHNYRKPKS